MAKRKIILHVGLPKCGSTALQFILASNQKALGEAGVIYPIAREQHARPGKWRNPAVSHMTLTTHLVDASDAGGVCTELARLRHDFDATGAHTMILSSEAFAGRARRISTTALGEAFDDCEIHVVMFMRRPDRLALSMYKQAVKMPHMRYSKPFSEFLANPPGQFRYLTRFRLAEMLDGLAAAFSPKAFHIHGLDERGADTRAILGKLIGLPLETWKGDAHYGWRRAEGSVNASMSDKATLFAALLNTFDLPLDVNRKAQFAVAKARIDNIAAKLVLLSPEISAQLIERAEPELARARRRFGIDVPVYEPVAPLPDAEYREALTLGEFKQIRKLILPKLKKRAPVLMKQGIPTEALMKRPERPGPAQRPAGPGAVAVRERQPIS